MLITTLLIAITALTTYKLTRTKPTAKPAAATKLAERAEHVVDWARARPPRSNLQRAFKKTALDNISEGLDRDYLPNEYTIGLTPTEYQAIHELAKTLANDLAEYLTTIPLNNTGIGGKPLDLIGKPRITFREDKLATHGTPRIIHAFSQDTALDPTRNHISNLKTPRLPERVATILINITDQTPYEIHLPLGTHTIGRNKDADLHVGHPTVSRHHATLTITPGEILIEDAHSRNGTKINDNPPITTPTTLTNGDAITLSRNATLLLVTGAE